MIYKLPESYFCKLTGLVLRTLQRIALFTVWGELTGLVLRTPQRIALFIVWGDDNGDDISGHPSSIILKTTDQLFFIAKINFGELSPIEIF